MRSGPQWTPCSGGRVGPCSTSLELTVVPEARDTFAVPDGMSAPSISDLAVRLPPMERLRIPLRMMSGELIRVLEHRSLSKVHSNTEPPSFSNTGVTGIRIGTETACQGL